MNVYLIQTQCVIVSINHSHFNLHKADVCGQ